MSSRRIPLSVYQAAAAAPIKSSQQAIAELNVRARGHVEDDRLDPARAYASSGFHPRLQVGRRLGK